MYQSQIIAADRQRWAPPALFFAAILSGSFLLFLVQPMVARMALPRLGGAPAVWNSAMLVYQALLLAGYGYAHALGRLAPRGQAVVHLGVLLVAALWLPIGLMAMDLPADAQPALWVPWLLGLSIGPLFFAVSAQAPLLQRWFSAAHPGRDPYALYAASNLGSFGGLIAYPLLVEPALVLKMQSGLWTAGYVLVILLVAGCALALPRMSATAVAATASPAPDRRTIGHWVLLAFVPSGMMLATTTYITTDIVAMPLLWVIPLGLYLLSFSIAFAETRFLADLITRFAPLQILLFGGVMVGGFQGMPYFNAGVALTLLFTISVALHTTMYRKRPAPDRLTGFYLMMSLGGVLGGVFAALVAPVLFDWTWEYPLLILAAGMLAPQALFIAPLARMWQGDAQRQRILTLAVSLVIALLIVFATRDVMAFQAGQGRGAVFAAIVALGLVALGRRLPFAIVLAGALVIFGGFQAATISWQGDARTRSYFGIYTINDDTRVRQLSHGTTVHGMQLIGSPARERTPTTYYVPGSGIGRAMRAADSLFGPQARIGVVGLGAGTLACYAHAGQAWRFYEIDPAIVRIARDTGQFSFLRRCLPGAEIAIGDARINLAAATPHALDLLALDAFSSDSVPMHLMTREAFASYDRALAPGGLLLVHISNRFLDLEPVVAAAADAGQWRAVKLTYLPGAKAKEGETVSAWVALSRSPASIDRLKALGGPWQPLDRRPGFTPWTDDYSTILPLLK
ncbi:MAG: fused MFS/spermidine synthase [Sphingomonas sp.]|uniref:fused MFS/spermidine synthase n=1 Tax=Sphingomonas sp. TaxID=28214 RepID=UPI0035A871D1|nr:fused MFS/spermidine synthase [Sphingomonas sp.]